MERIGEIKIDLKLACTTKEDVRKRHKYQVDPEETRTKGPKQTRPVEKRSSYLNDEKIWIQRNENKLL